MSSHSGRVVITVTKFNRAGEVKYISWQQNADPWCRIDMPQQNVMTMPHLSWRNHNGFLWQKAFSWNWQVFHAVLWWHSTTLPLLPAVLVHTFQISSFFLSKTSHCSGSTCRPEECCCTSLISRRYQCPVIWNSLPLDIWFLILVIF